MENTGVAARSAHGPAERVVRNTRFLGDVAVAPVTLGTLAFGTRLDERGARAVVDAAVESGVTSFDTADVYGFGASEVMLGRVVGRRRRHRVVLATKFGITMNGRNGEESARSSPSYIRRAVTASLRRLGTDYIDLYQWHSPDRRTPVEETLGALDELVSQGLVRAVGVCNLTAGEIGAVVEVGNRWRLSPVVAVQNEYSLYNRSAEADLLPACQRHGIGVLPYFPLAAGLLSGAYRPNSPAPVGSRLAHSPTRLAAADWDVLGRIDAVAARLGRPIAELALAYLASQPAVVSVVVGATTPEQIRSNARAVAEPLPASLLSSLQQLPHAATGYTPFASRRVTPRFSGRDAL